MSASGIKARTIQNVRGANMISPDPKPEKRLIDKPYVNHVAKYPCFECGRPSGPPHHVRAYGWGATSRKPDDYYVVPICYACHDNIHNKPKMFDKTDLLLAIIKMLISWIRRGR